MSLQPRVLVPLGTDNKDGNYGHGECHFARKNYLEKLFAHGLLPILISPFTPVEDGITLLQECDGLYLMGGDDINAQLYGEDNHEKNVIVIPERDRLEYALTQHALKHSIPLLGICRGCQMMAVASGGKLIQHIPDVQEAAAHSAGTFVRYHEWVSSTEHTVSIMPDSNIARLLSPSTSLTLNSAHHQSVQTLEDPLQIAAITSDGIIEIIEHTNPEVFAFGIQSHPEVPEMTPLEPLFQEFAKACKKESLPVK
ncbi:MAG: gamma-glutamyl-gamma-aminobutyrate hydrolase family protein [Bdellovibrionales bacterium]|nr:gamma-glutamyl-gamma-aminobutyrate hydrolase family protein [Bdellovibrionales bacterium]